MKNEKITLCIIKVPGKRIECHFNGPCSACSKMNFKIAPAVNAGEQGVGLNRSAAAQIATRRKWS